LLGDVTKLAAVSDSQAGVTAGKWQLIDGQTVTNSSTGKQIKNHYQMKYTVQTNKQTLEEHVQD